MGATLLPLAQRRKPRAHGALLQGRWILHPRRRSAGQGQVVDQRLEEAGGFESHKVIPLSVTFDHRACTGGEAARFLKALIDDLALPY